MNHLVTFATADMSRAQELCEDSAMAHGSSMAHHYREYSLASFPDQHLLAQSRGFGFWSWKPYVVLDAMNLPMVSNGDVIVYSDAGIEVINSVSHIIDRMDQDIFLFGNNYDHAHWCKRDIADEVWNLPALDQPYYDYSPLLGGAVINEDGELGWEHFGKQVQASVIFFRVSDYSRQFVKEWLDWCLFEGGRLIDDSPSRTPNHPEFRENRHDQAILSTLADREGIKKHWWPASYNDGAFIYERGDYPDEGYPVMFNHHRKRDHEWAKCA